MVLTSVDQTGRVVSIPDYPQRIISVVPSQTELISDLGLTSEVIGITRFCIHPEKWFSEKEKVGGTKQLNLEQIGALKPDLIIANKEENEKSQVEELARQFPVWVSDISTLADAKKMILSLGTFTGRIQEAVRLLNRIDVAFDRLSIAVAVRKPVSVAYLIWNKPLMAAGGNTFIDSMLSLCGFSNCFSHLSRYPEVSEAQLISAKPDFIFLSSEPYPFKEKHEQEFISRFPGIRSLRVDGEIFSWYGSRLQHAPTYFLKLFEQIDSVK